MLGVVIEDRPAGWLVQQLFRYVPETGELVWAKTRNKFMKVGKVAGTKTKTGVNVGINGKVFTLRQLVWTWHHGDWPKGRIWHKDGDKFNTRIENLEERGVNKAGRKKTEKPTYTEYQEIPIPVVSEYFQLDGRNIPCWKKASGPKVEVGSQAGRRYGNTVYVGFKGFIIDATDITYALLNGEWPKK